MFIVCFKHLGKTKYVMKSATYTHNTHLISAPPHASDRIDIILKFLSVRRTYSLEIEIVFNKYVVFTTRGPLVKNHCSSDHWSPDRRRVGDSICRSIDVLFTVKTHCRAGYIFTKMKWKYLSRHKVYTNEHTHEHGTHLTNVKKYIILKKNIKN